MNTANEEHYTFGEFFLTFERRTLDDFLRIRCPPPPRSSTLKTDEA